MSICSRSVALLPLMILPLAAQAQTPPAWRAMTTDDVKYSWDRFKATNLSRSDLINSINKDAPIESLTFPDTSTVVV